MSSQDQSLVDQLSRLDNIRTRWSLVRGAARPDDTSIVETRNALILRYASAIRGYIAAIVRNEELADELAQDAVVRLLQGDFAGADPAKGRFRDLLKVALRNMARNHWAKQKVRKADALSSEIASDSEAPDDPWVVSWRDHLLKLAWKELDRVQSKQPDRCLYDVMKVRVELPEAKSPELAAQLGHRTGRTMTPENYRQQLKRARDRFARAVLEELTDTLENPSQQRVQDELAALGLHVWMKNLVPALDADGVNG